MPIAVLNVIHGWIRRSPDYILWEVHIVVVNFVFFAVTIVVRILLGFLTYFTVGIAVTM